METPPGKPHVAFEVLSLTQTRHSTYETPMCHSSATEDSAKKPSINWTGHTTAAQQHDTGRHIEVIVVNRPGAQCLWASAPERWHFVDLVEHAVQPLENENEGGSHGFRCPVGDGQHLHDVAP